MSSKRPRSSNKSNKRYCLSNTDIKMNINELYHKDEVKSRLSQFFKSSKNIQLGISLFLVKIHLAELTKQLDCLKFKEKNNDLFNFKQSSDLKKVKFPAIKAFRNIMYHDFHAWLKEMTAIQLFEEVSMSCSQYDYTDVLLCHDDELENRRIAFIFYLVPDDWTEKDGGKLDLFSIDGDGQPSRIKKSIVPIRNQLILFEVTPISFHQVSEVFSKDKSRITIGGWYHGPSVKRPPPFIKPSPSLISPKFIEEKMVYSWINPSYIDMATQKEIRTKFKELSEIELEKFINFEKYEEICNALKENRIKWKEVGPANRRCYESCEMNSLPEIINQFIKLMQSEALFLILSSLTGLKFHELASYSDSDSEEEGETSESGNSSCYAELTRWGHQNYSLVRDDDFNSSKSCLNALMYFNCDGWTREMGGFASYIAKEDEQELLTVDPRPNTLSLVYKDGETHSFVKYINNEMKSREKFCNIIFTYFE
ncbi:Prolyl 3-hydroxylase OGFOD1 [Nymphon striatum]|nr:Prolyl 3-hydroxylase OGFOD1 [Nymphon striatum]